MYYLVTLQRKDITVQDAVSAVGIAKAFYECIRPKEEFNRFYTSTTELADKYSVASPVLLHYRRRPE